MGRYQLAIRQMGVALATAAIATAVVTACTQRHDQCWDNPCDEYGNLLVWAPLIIPGFGIYGHPGYRAPVIIMPGAPGYRPTFQGKPPNYNPPKPVAPPAPGQTKAQLSTPRNTGTQSKPASQSRSTAQRTMAPAPKPRSK